MAIDGREQLSDGLTYEVQLRSGGRFNPLAAVGDISRPPVRMRQTTFDAQH